jgi:hypothetical protein
VKWTAVAILASILATGCSHDINNKEAVRQGVIDYLNKRREQTGLDMSLLNVDVSNVAFQKNEATATVSFQPKGGGAQGMSMNYVLERRGDKWVVKGRKESGMNPHGAQGMPGMPGMGMPPAGQSGALPPGHPPTSGAPSDKK